MSESDLDQELLRRRWRRARRALSLLDPYTETFGIGGLASKLDEPSVRLLVLSSDPERGHLRFESALWDFFLQNRPDPATARPALWEDQRPTAGAMVRFDPVHDVAGHWRRYIALGRSGGLELGLGGRGVFEMHGHRIFRLIPIVAEIWTALDLYREFAALIGLAGPWEVTLAVLKTEGAWLGHVAEGWAEPWNPMARGSARDCTEPGLLFRQELATWPDPDGIRELAFDFGGLLEDSWGFRERRFLARLGPYPGRFDISRYHGS